MPSLPASPMPSLERGSEQSRTPDHAAASRRRPAPSRLTKANSPPVLIWSLPCPPMPPVIIAPGGRAAIPTGLAIALPRGWKGRSGHAPGLRCGMGLPCSTRRARWMPIIAAKYKLILANFGTAPFPVERGARIAQLVLAATVQAAICEVANLMKPSRGVRGFGSTGTGREEANRWPRKLLIVL
jgi:dUTP pyrophosphatase